LSNQKEHSKAWYLVPVIFGILGGLVMYIGLKETNAKMAKRGLILSIVITAASVLIYVPIVLLGTITL